MTTCGYVVAALAVDWVSFLQSAQLLMLRGAQYAGLALVGAIAISGMRRVVIRVPCTTFWLNFGRSYPVMNPAVLFLALRLPLNRRRSRYLEGGMKRSER